MSFATEETIMRHIQMFPGHITPQKNPNSRICQNYLIIYRKCSGFIKWHSQQYNQMKIPKYIDGN